MRGIKCLSGFEMQRRTGTTAGHGRGPVGDEHYPIGYGRLSDRIRAWSWGYNPPTRANVTLAAGMKLGPHDIVAGIGHGGRGKVYRAIDTRLGRPVAIRLVNGETFATRLGRGRLSIKNALDHARLPAPTEASPGSATTP